MACNGCLIQAKSSSSCLVYEVIALIGLPACLNEMRVLRANRKHKVEYSLPFGTKAWRNSVLQSPKINPELVLKRLAGEYWERVVHLQHITLKQSFRYLQLRQVVSVNKKVHIDMFTIRPEAEGAHLLVAWCA